MRNSKRISSGGLGRKQITILMLCLASMVLLFWFDSCRPKPKQAIIPYQAESWVPKVWKSEPPEGCPFEPSKDIKGIAFTGRYATYTDADTWYPSWADDGNLYSGWTDGEIGKESCHSSGGAKARTGNAKIIGDDPLNLTIISLGNQPASALPYGGRYPSANLVYNGVWYYGTYCIDFDFSKPEYPDQYSWAICGPVPGFRISTDCGQTWTPSPLSPENPLFPESGKNGQQVKMGTPHFVDFGRNLEYSPDGKAYLVGHGALDNDPTPRVANNSWIAGDAVYLARVTPSPKNINDPKAYEFFAGFDSAQKPIWSKNFDDLKPLLVWDDHMGCTTITYNAPLRKYLMCITDGWPGVADMNSYILEADQITGPYRLITYMKEFGPQGYFLNFPSKFIGKDGRTLWLSYSANFHKDYFANRAIANPLGSRYAWCLQEVTLLDENNFQALIDQKQKDPLKSEDNIALRARVSVSSVEEKSKPMTELPQYFGEGAVDGVIEYKDEINLHEWVSQEKSTAIIRLSWDQPETVRKVWLFDLPNLKDHVLSGLLVFSDGNSLRVDELPNDARSAREISFPAKKITWLVFIIDSVSKETRNAGLAEIAVFK
ncbi:MAG TPA: DUF4185 domain-containing protein [Candidatus Aminicenantes bacterium]|nr:MAG: hypothetical protein C0168_00165 [Candidatus Aminicenantes bacterium]HEK86175.1 DUF4185 domain-containing protein [Candidatus Aminicenantes bacterium]